MEELINNLIHVTRYNGVHLIKSESDSDHVWGMISLALGNIGNINKSYKELYLPTVDVKSLIYKIVVHDIGECFYGDIPRTFKYKTETLKAAIDEAEQLMMKEAFPKGLIIDINNAKDYSLEGRYVRLLDWIQAGTKMCTEAKLGNQYMRSQLVNILELLDYELETDIDIVRKEFIKKYRDKFEEVYNGK